MLLGAINKSSPTDYGPWMTLRLTGTPKNTMPNATKALTLTPPAQPMSPLLRFLTRCLNHNLSHFKALSLLDRLIFKNISIVGDNGATDLWKGQRNPVRLVGGTRGSVYRTFALLRSSAMALIQILLRRRTYWFIILINKLLTTL